MNGYYAGDKWVDEVEPVWREYTFADYARDSALTANPDIDQPLIVAALGLCGESGEFADMVKKQYFQGHEQPTEKLIEEVGDIMWYVALACRALHVDIADVALLNSEKLRRRYPHGFSTDKSVNR